MYAVGIGGLNIYTNLIQIKYIMKSPKKYVARLGIKPRTPASLVKCSTTELSSPISTVHLA